MPRIVVHLLAVCVLAGLVTACQRDDGADLPEFDPHGHEDEQQAEEVHDLIQELRYGAYDDPESEARYFEAQQKLIQYGTAIQVQLLEALRGSEFWGVRYGTLHVLDAVGDRGCIEALIETLDDEHPLVALKALYLLRHMTDHREIPEEGVAENGLPAVPDPVAGDPVDMHEQLWNIWHGQHGERLQKSWSYWWTQNKLKTSIEE